MWGGLEVFIRAVAREKPKEIVRSLTPGVVPCGERPLDRQDKGQAAQVESDQNESRKDSSLSEKRKGPNGQAVLGQWRRPPNPKAALCKAPSEKGRRKGQRDSRRLTGPDPDTMRSGTAGAMIFAG